LSKEKPLLTTKMKKDREWWVMDHGPKLTNKEVPVVFLDKKWFYKRNRRRVLKELPAEDGEDEELCRVKRPKATSRWFPNKIMYMGIVACPREEYNFDGKIDLI